MKCFYHRADHDGLCSAAIVKRAHPEAELVGIDYGEPFPWEQVDPGEEVWLVDFSLPPADMFRLDAYTRGADGFYNLVWIDHHKTAIEAMKGRIFKGLIADGVGACALTWRYCFPDQDMPLAVRLLAAYDVWDHADDQALDLHYGLWVNGPEDRVWNFLLDDNRLLLDELIARGHAIRDYERKENAARAACLCFDFVLDGLKCLMANFGPSNSAFFDSRWDPEKYQAMCLFSWRPGVGKWKVSLYTTRADVDVSAVCKARGGGGHRGAAGFEVDSLLDLGLEPKTAALMADYKGGFERYYGALDK